MFSLDEKAKELICKLIVKSRRLTREKIEQSNWTTSTIFSIS